MSDRDTAFNDALIRLTSDPDPQVASAAHRLHCALRDRDDIARREKNIQTVEEFIRGAALNGIALDTPTAVQLLDIADYTWRQR